MTYMIRLNKDYIDNLYNRICHCRVQNEWTGDEVKSRLSIKSAIQVSADDFR